MRRWTIKVRVVQKSELRPFCTASGQGTIFTADLLDADGSQIRAKAFNQAADRLYQQLQLDTVVLVSAATIRPTDTVRLLATLIHSDTTYISSMSLFCCPATSTVHHILCI